MNRPFTPRESAVSCLLWFGVPAGFWGGLLWLVMR